ncbi:MAG: NAD(P)-dependent oxidoreductase [Candidatus Nanohaloarchaea archaeon]
MKVAWFDAQDWEREYLEKEYPDFEVDFFSESLDRDSLERANEYDVVAIFVDSRLDAELVEDLDVNLIACRSTGYDHVDIERAAEKGIPVCNVPGYADHSVAEHTFALLLGISRKIHSSIHRVKEGDFSHESLRGFELRGKKLGVIGTGSIGKEVIDIANGFDMHVIASDPDPDHAAAEEMGFMYVSQEDLIEQADIISLHAPLTDVTEHMLGEEEFEKMDGTVLLNTSRGELVDTEALLEALEDGSVEAAGLDVLEEECFFDDDISYLGDVREECDIETILEDHILVERDDVLVTPHNGFNSEEAVKRIEDVTVRNIRTRSNIVNRPGQ